MRIRVREKSDGEALKIEANHYGGEGDLLVKIFHYQSEALQCSARYLSRTQQPSNSPYWIKFGAQKVPFRGEKRFNAMTH